MPPKKKMASSPTITTTQPDSEQGEAERAEIDCRIDFASFDDELGKVGESEKLPLSRELYGKQSAEKKRLGSLLRESERKIVALQSRVAILDKDKALLLAEIDKVM